MSKIYDVCLPIGEYKDGQGNTKKRYRTIGAVMESEHGPYLLLHADALSMQLFALANRDRRDSVLVSLFDADRQNASEGAPGPDDDIPY